MSSSSCCAAIFSVHESEAQLKQRELDTIGVTKSGLPAAVTELQAMTDIGENDADTLASWLMQSGSLPREERRETMKSVYNFFVRIHQSVKIALIERVLKTKRSGANTVQDRQHKWRFSESGTGSCQVLWKSPFTRS